MTRTRSSAKKAGSKAETDVATYAATQLQDDRIERRTKNGNKDRGDIAGIRTLDGARVVVEVKDHSTLKLSEWIAEAETERANDDAAVGVVWHKRRGHSSPGNWYVTMTGATFMRLLGVKVQALGDGVA